MSGLKESALVEFHRSLRPLGGVGGLAELARVGRSHLCQVLAGDRSGINTWKRILPLLSDSQVMALTQCGCWNESAAVELARIRTKRISEAQIVLAFVSDGTLCYVEQEKAG